MRSQRPPEPTDAVLVYRAVRADDLEAAAQAVRACGVPCLPVWRPSAVPAGRMTSGMMVHGDGELRVPRAHAPRAVEALRAHEGAVRQRIREHLREAPSQLRRAALFAGAVVLPILAVAGVARGVVLALAIPWGLLAAWELALGIRRARRAGPPPAGPPARWFEREERG